jgi:alpha-tubulin suppressor-like RCC1 family protein
VLQRRLRVQAAAVGERGAALVSAASVAAAFLTDCVGQPCARASSSDLWSTEFPAELVLGPHGAFDQHAVLSVAAVLPSGSRRAPCPHALIGPLLAECGLRLRPAACRALQEQGALPSTQRVWRSAEDGSDFAPSAALPRIANGRDEVAVLERALRRTLECELRSSWEGEEKAPEGGARRSAAVEQRRYEALVTAVFGGGEAERELPPHTSGGRATRAGAAARTRALLARGGGAQAAARAALRSDDALVPLELVHALTSDALRTTLSAAKHIPTLRRRVALVARALRATLECGVTAHMPTADAVARALLTVYLHELCALAGKLKRKMPTRLVTLAALAEERANCASASGGAWQSNAELIDAFDVARGAARGAGASGRAAPRATLEAIVALGAKDATALPGAARSSGANAELRAAALAASKGAAAEEAGCDDASRYLEGIWSGRGGAGNARGGGDYGGVVAWGLPTGLDGEVEMVLDWKTQGPFNEWHVPIAEATADGVELQRGAPPCGCRRDVRPSTVVVRVACGYRHTALITQRGSLLTFGHGVCGRLGHGDEVDRRAPTVVAALAECEVVAASCGREHTAALTADGRVFTWGWGEAGRLGHGDEDPLSAPRSVAFFAATHSVERIGVATAVACGREHTLVCTAGGALFAFGAGSSYRLGTGDQEDRLKPVRIDTDALAGELVCALAGGEAHSAALCRSGSLFTWGFGRAGALGHGGDEHEKTPRRLEHPQRVASVACGAYHTAFVTAPGELWSCGDGSSGQLGVCPEGLDATQTALDDFTVLSSSAPRRQRVGEGGREQRTIVSVECGFWQTVACDAGGRLYRWGACGGERALGARIEERGVGGALAAARLGAAENVWSHAGVGRWQTIACTAAIGHSSISSAMRSSCDAGAAVLEGDARVKARCSRFAPPLPFPSHDRGTSTHVVLLGVHDVRRAAVPVDTALGVTHLESLAPHSIVSIASGAAHSLALTANGAVFAWGASGRGGAGPAALCATSSGAQVSFLLPLHFTRIMLTI